jgi:hypothetical protein
LVQCLLLLGMHRSGTSALAGALENVGVGFGDSLMPPDPGDNPRGYFEDLEIFDLHERMLDRAGFSWDDPRPLDLKSLPAGAMDPNRAELIQLLRDRFVGRPLWAVKDPRLCLLAPEWTEILSELEVSPGFVIVYRHPAEVAASLASRNGFSAEKSAGLWLQHNLAAEAATRGRPRAFLSYDELLAHPVEALTTLGETLGMDWPVAPCDVAEPLGEFLLSGLRNHSLDGVPEPNWGRFTPWMASFFEKLGSVQGQDSLALQAGSDEIRGELLAARNSLESPPLEHAGQLAASLRIEVRRLRERLGTLDEDSELRFSRLNDWISDQEHERSRERKLITGLEEQLEDRARWLQVQGDQIKAMTEALSSVQAQLDERTQWLQIQSESIDVLHKEIETIKESIPKSVKTTKD